MKTSGRSALAVFLAFAIVLIGIGIAYWLGLFGSSVPVSSPVSQEGQPLPPVSPEARAAVLGTSPSSSAPVASQAQVDARASVLQSETSPSADSSSASTPAPASASGPSADERMKTLSQ